MIFDTEKNGLETLFKPYQAELLEWIWKQNRKRKVGTTSSQAYVHLQKSPESKSRASVIFFLNSLVDKGVFTYEEETGKGGYHRVYYPEMNGEEFAVHVNQLIKNKLKEVFPSAA